MNAILRIDTQKWLFLPFFDHDLINAGRAVETVPVTGSYRRAD